MTQKLCNCLTNCAIFPERAYFLDGITADILYVYTLFGKCIYLEHLQLSVDFNTRELLLHFCQSSVHIF